MIVQLVREFQQNRARSLGGRCLGLFCLCLDDRQKGAESEKRHGRRRHFLCNDRGACELCRARWTWCVLLPVFGVSHADLDVSCRPRDHHTSHASAITLQSMDETPRHTQHC